MLRRALTITLFSSSLVAQNAFAQPKSETAAQAVFTEGLAKFDHGDFQAACPLLEKAVALSSTPALGGVLTLAECFEKIDRPASAWGLYKKVAAQAATQGQKDRADKARKAAERLEPTLPKVKFVWHGEKPPPAGLNVQYGDETVPFDVWNVALPADPGATQFTFAATDKASKVVSVEVQKGASITEVSAPDFDGSASEPSTQADRPLVGEPTPLSGPSPSPTPEHGGIHGLGVGGIVTGVLGIAGMGASAGVIVDAKSKWNTALTHDCGGNIARCKTLTGIDSARNEGDVASVLFGVGVGLTAIGTSILIADLVMHAKKAPSARSVPSFAFGVAPTAHQGAAGFATFEWRIE